MKFISICLCCFYFLKIQGQSPGEKTTYSNLVNHVDTLTAPAFKGRSITNMGAFNAGEYIAQKYTEFQLRYYRSM